MRPLRLDIEGFGTFRDPVTLDFSDADFFAFVGPTGSGKTTLIDAICFALYGSVPRWPRSNQVSMAMAPSTNHTRVVLVFEVAGQRYAAARVLARSARGAVTTKQARLASFSSNVSLEGDLADLLDNEAEEHASSPDDMDAAVEALLGLTFAHFTQAVVLPQGDFDRFLHASKAERQDLLVSLLGLSVYEKVAQRANQVAKEAALRADTLGKELLEYADATQEHEDAAHRALGAITTVEDHLEETLAPWRAAEAARADAAATAAELISRHALVAGVTSPNGLAQLAEARARATEALAEAQQAEAAAEAALLAAEKEAGEAGTPSVWEQLRRDHEAFAGLAERGTRAAEAERTTGAAAEEAAHTLARAEQALAEARTAHEHVRLSARADDLATALLAGAECPVCLQPVTTVPDRPAHPGLADAARGVTDAEKQVEAAHRRLAEAQAQHQRAAGTLAELRTHYSHLSQRLADQPDTEQARERLAHAQAAQTAYTAATQAARATRTATQQAHAGIAALEQEWVRAGRELSGVRDRLAALAPPPVTGDHIADWATMTDWATAQSGELSAAISAGESDRQRLEKAESELRTALVESLAEAGVRISGSFSEVAVSTAVARAVATAQSALERIQERRKHAARISEDISAAKSSEALHKQLATLLGARNFERWMVEEALQALVAEASATLAQLSSGQFELAINDKQDMLVIDHNDASNSRPVQTLSGGETFQASLALALALSSQIAALSPHSGQLDTILLDEGFGTLDPSTLDIVAATMEQLAGGGERTVGLVTHVAELAERVPVRFEVNRTGSRSSVEKRYV